MTDVGTWTNYKQTMSFCVGIYKVAAKNSKHIWFYV